MLIWQQPLANQLEGIVKNFKNFKIKNCKKQVFFSNFLLKEQAFMSLTLLKRNCSTHAFL